MQDQNIPHRPSGPSPLLSPREFLRSRHLILLSQSLSTASQQAIQHASGFAGHHADPAMMMVPPPSPRRKHDPSAFILGLCVVEYEARDTPGHTTRAYIQYVDTTGMVRPRSLQGLLTRNLLKAYIRYARDILHAGHLHLFASPKPSLLFAGSEAMGRKGCLGGRALISWWLALLADTLQDRADGNARVFAYAPGEELSLPTAHHTRHCIQRLQQCYATKPNAVGWCYGMPFDPEAAALTAIPAFEDDPMWRHLEALLDDCGNPVDDDGMRARKRLKQDSRVVTVREFMRTLGCRAEFSSDHAALMCVAFGPPSSPSRTQPDGSGKADLASCGLRLLRTVTFCTEQEAVRATQKTLTLLRMMGVGAGSGAFDLAREPEDGSSDHFKRVLEMLQPANAGSDCLASSAGVQPVPVVDLQATVRRKVPRHVN
jgi:hypothetical protein